MPIRVSPPRRFIRKGQSFDRTHGAQVLPARRSLPRVQGKRPSEQGRPNWRGGVPVLHQRQSVDALWQRCAGTLYQRTCEGTSGGRVAVFKRGPAEFITPFQVGKLPAGPSLWFTDRYPLPPFIKTAVPQSPLCTLLAERQRQPQTHPFYVGAARPLLYRYPPA